MAKKNDQVSAVRKAKHGWLLSLIFAVISVLWIAPLLIVLLNSFKRKAYIFRYPFGFSAASLSDGWDAFVEGAKTIFCGGMNYSNGLKLTNFWSCFGNSLLITVGSVFLIILCCSMCAWYIVRVNSKGTKFMYLLCLFSMIVPFQMVMFTLSKFANMLHLSNPLGIMIVYLGFGAGLAVFMFTGFVKGISLEIEEAAMIDGCSPVQTFFRVVFPILKPTTVTVAILEAMWVWNDYLLPSLVLNINKYKTIPIAVQYLKQSHGQVDWGAMMAVLVLAILPIIIFYIACQKYIIEGVLAGAVKG
ncbi:MAG: carbohydrate ABC transporter permease [Muribaculaceae bacterium]|nr:carbohydrate ABC transporter permease [Roseburia sp.]MCM1429942.1 carbohydrate ABC transporter permease [Muribaculaceae bacterium]MCM1493031.1 carbohydrate ABC transporter permease [Muribaculaceae bacterium]